MVFPSEERPLYAPFFSVMGASSAMIFRYDFCGVPSKDKNNNTISSAMGAAYGTAKSGVGIAAMAIMKPERIMKSVIPIIMAGIVAIYGVVVAVLISQKTKDAANIMEVRITTINIFQIISIFKRTLLIWVLVLP